MLTRLVFVGVLAHAAYVSATGPDDIPVAGSQVIPGEAPCGLPEMPDPVLAACDVGLHPTVPDHRGSWVSNTTNHTERIEQCEDRYTVSGPASDDLYYVHYFYHADGTKANGVHDFDGGHA